MLQIKTTNFFFGCELLCRDVSSGIEEWDVELFEKGWREGSWLVLGGGCL